MHRDLLILRQFADRVIDTALLLVPDRLFLQIRLVRKIGLRFVKRQLRTPGSTRSV